MITLTESGKVFDISGYNLRVYFDDETYSDDVSVVNGCIEFVLPSVLAGERLCELRVKEKDDKFFFSPMFRILVEESIGSKAESLPVGKDVRYQEVTSSLPATDIVSEDDEIAVSSDGLSHRTKVSNLPFAKPFENEDVLKKIGEEYGSINFNGEEISLSAVKAFILTAITLLSESKSGFWACVDSPQGASMPTSEAAIFLDSLYGASADLYFSPTESGDLTFNDSVSGKTKTMKVKKGVVYKFYVNYEAFQIDYCEVNSIEDARVLLGYLNNIYAVKNDIPSKLSAFENDRGFVSKATVNTMIDDALDGKDYVLTDADKTEIADMVKPKLTKEEIFSDYETGLVHTRIMTQTITIECASLPINARVRKIEIPDVFNDTDNYLLLEDMVSYEPVPYSVMYPKNMQGEFFPVAALIVFSLTPNSFYDATELNLLESKTIKIYYEIEE